MAFEEENKYSNLEELNGSNYQIVEGEPDITGWDVVDAENRKIGEVDDVLFDPQSRDVRYMIVDLSENELDIEVKNKVLIPIGIAELRNQYDDDITETETLEEQPEVDGNLIDNDEDDTYDDDDDDDVVYLPSVTAEQLLALPVYEKGTLSPENEMVIRSVFEKPATTDAVIVYNKDDFYTHEHFNNKIYGERDQDIFDTNTEEERYPRDLSQEDEELDDTNRGYKDPNKDF